VLTQKRKKVKTSEYYLNNSKNGKIVNNSKTNRPQSHLVPHGWLPKVLTQRS